MSKRPEDSSNEAKRQKLSASQDVIAKAKARLLQKQQLAKNNAQNKEDGEGKGGLNVEIHPLLRNIAPTPVLPKNHNPLKQNVRKWFDPTAMNPYLNQSDISGKQNHKSRPLQFNTKGKYIAEANEIRAKIAQQEQEKKIYQEKQARGLTADENLGEHFFKPENPPLVEWWDKAYLKKNTYDIINDESQLDYDNESAPISIYIQHPVLIPPPWEVHETELKPMYLTKTELKRIRRNERQVKIKDKQDRIKLGLDAPPPPKVKLSNLMNVLTNESIKDPTAIEMRVREEVQERIQKHLDQNEARKLTKEEQHEKAHLQREKDLEKGFFTTVFKIDKLANPQHLYKIDVNAKQLELLGICLVNPRFNLVVVEGGEKSMKFYRKLLSKRIDWTVNVAPKDEQEPHDLEDLSNNKCLILWEGQIKDLRFKKWSIMRSRNDDEAFDVLQRFGIENYWREALTME